MSTLGKRVSSCVAVAIVWVGGSVCLQLLSGLLFAILRGRGENSVQTASSIELWTMAAMPLVACIGGTLAIWLVRAVSGWPRLPAGTLFLRTVGLSIFSLLLMPANDVRVVAVAANLLALVGVAVFTWQKAGRGELGTHMFPDASRTEK